MLFALIFCFFYARSAELAGPAVEGITEWMGLSFPCFGTVTYIHLIYSDSWFGPRGSPSEWSRLEGTGLHVDGSVRARERVDE